MQAQPDMPPAGGAQSTGRRVARLGWRRPYLRWQGRTRPRWVGSVGWMSVVVGGAMLLAMPLTAIQVHTVEALHRRSWAPPWRLEDGSGVMAAHILFLLAQTGLAAVLLAGGINLLRMSRLGVRLHQFYAGVGTIVALVYRAAMSTVPTTDPDFVRVAMYVALLAATVYPVFVLVWFMRRKVSRQTLLW